MRLRHVGTQYVVDDGEDDILDYLCTVVVGSSMVRCWKDERSRWGWTMA